MLQIQIRARCTPLVAAVVSMLTGGCGWSPGAPPVTDRTRTSSGALTFCSFDLPDDVTAVLAYDDGLAIARENDREELVHRTRGAGCELEPIGAPVAADALLDVDDDGTLYVFPAEPAPGSAAINTMLPGEYRGSMAARVDATTSAVTKLLPAGRGIWSFGVSPHGDALWVASCGPTGLFDIVSPTTVERSTQLDEPATLWAMLPAVLTSNDTFWSVGTLTSTCDPSAPRSDACGHALVRTTQDGSEEVASTVMDFGAGFERAMLTRCGDDVCGVFPSAVVRWNRDGAVVDTVTHVELDVWRGEAIESATANAHGLYVVLRKNSGGARVVFMP